MQTDIPEDSFTIIPQKYLGLFCAGIGVILILGAIFDWDWIIEGHRKTAHITWIRNTFGRKFTRFFIGFVGILLVVLGSGAFILENY